MRDALPIASVTAALEVLYGRPDRPPSDPLELILRENVVYLADDARRAAAFELLRERIGIRPDQILAADDETMEKVTRSAGILPQMQVEKLRRVAQLASELRPDDIVKLPLREAKKALMRFPGTGEPGAEKILLFSRSYPILALDSNALRVMLRLGFGQKHRDYRKSYRSAQGAVAEKLPDDFDELIDVAQLLRIHGQRLCLRSNPKCFQCPLKSGCEFARVNETGREG